MQEITQNLKTEWKLFGIVLVISVVISGAFIGLLILTQQEPRQVVVPMLTPLQQTEVDTSNWQIYRNEEFEFEVKYPNNLLIVVPYIGPDPTGYDFAVQVSNIETPFGIWCGEEEREFGVNPCVSNQAVYIFVRDLELHEETLQEVIGFSSIEFNTQELVTINGLNFIKVGTSFPMYFIERQSVVYSFSWAAGETVRGGSRELYSQILSTFRFLDE